MGRAEGQRATLLLRPGDEGAGSIPGKGYNEFGGCQTLSKASGRDDVVNQTMASAELKVADATGRVLEVRWPWWLHPAWALLLLVGGTAATSVFLPADYYAIWGVNKFLDNELSFQLLLGILFVLIGILVANYGKARGGGVRIKISETALQYLKRTYRVLVALTVLGYCFWGLVALSEGVGASDVMAVFQRELGAISELKANSRPVGGVTTLTQFGPVAVVVGAILRKLGAGGRSYWWIVALAMVRSLLYAERLALLEVLFPLILVSALTVRQRGGWRLLTQIVPLILGPLVWLVFAISEYSRSWVFYQNVVAIPFGEWVTSRLLGYYITAYNNSALFANSYENTHSVPYMSVQAFWNSPGVSEIVPRPLWFGYQPEQWWSTLLRTKSNPEFNSIGSFLVAYAEMGWVLGSMFWLTAGLSLGLLFASMTRGSLMALMAYCSIFIGVLELPRFIYWTQGRAVPIVLALVVIYWCWPQIKRSRNVVSLEQKVD